MQEKSELMRSPFIINHSKADENSKFVLQAVYAILHAIMCRIVLSTSNG